MRPTRLGVPLIFVLLVRLMLVVLMANPAKGQETGTVQIVPGGPWAR
jgi:hypothetical protein